MAVTYQTEGVKMPDIKKRETTEWIKAVAASYGKRLGEIAYIFCSDEKILEVNRQYLQHDYYTDIITFDYCEGDRLSGDLFISLDTIRTNAEQFGASYDDELHRVIIHGILHLCGINDKGPGEREIMEDAENKALTMRKHKQASTANNFNKQTVYSNILYCINTVNRAGGKRSSFLPTFVFRPLTPPYVPFGIRRFLFWAPLR